ncbi:zinc finger protein 260-like [Pollicipes pollicipes]|uniref:zinc finger protein 260-like n=1 Tax=Pollicipes pollicipes TaxID=41117 RepID=UPI001884AC6D|nr:zinc finger protein 260-like [Pollicipes pollicipes]
MASVKLEVMTQTEPCWLEKDSPGKADRVADARLETDPKLAAEPADSEGEEESRLELEKVGPVTEQRPASHIVLQVERNASEPTPTAAGEHHLIVSVDDGSDAVTLLVDRLEEDGVYELAGPAASDCELLELWACGTDGGEQRPLETVREVDLVDIRAVCETCGCAISHYMVGLLAREDGSEYGYRCRMCQSVFRDVDDMACHMDSHRSPADTRCRFCSCGLQSLRQAANARTWVCHACKLTFGTRQEMLKHREQHPLKERFPCELCDKAFQMKVQLEVHMRSHLGHKPYSCDMCPATFVQPSHLINHRRTHTGERPFSCEQCGRAFVQQGHLKAHLRTHTGERPYRCDVCGRAFRQSGQLTAHRRLHESGTVYRVRRQHGEPIDPQELTCRECDKRFKAIKDLRRHMLVHSGGTHECAICRRFFKRSDHLKRHMRQHDKPARPARPRGRRRKASAERGPTGADPRGLALLDNIIDGVLEVEGDADVGCTMYQAQRGNSLADVDVNGLR